MGSITASRGLAIGAVSRVTSVNIETIRYYERIGLMPKPPRTGGDRRSYQPEHVERLRFIRRARTLGFGLDGIRTLLILSTRAATSCAQAREIAVAHLADVRAKRDDFAKLEALLADTIAQCDARCCGPGVPACPIFEVLTT